MLMYKMVKCLEQTCKKQAFFGDTVGGTPIFCGTHRNPSHIDVYAKRCIIDGCMTQSTYGIEGTTKTTHCFKHKTADLVNIVDKRCIVSGCTTLPIFGIQGGKAIHCNAHKESNEIDLKHSKTMCQFSGCTTRASYNFLGNTKAIYCGTHSLKDMIDVFGRRCLVADCYVEPAYNYPGEKKRIYCKTHALKDMINLRRERCIHEGCLKHPSYGYETNMKPIYCFDHHIIDTVNVKTKKCKMEMCQTSASKKYDGYCLFCFIHLFPDKKTTRNYKTKEVSVAEYVKKMFPDVTWVTDKKIENGCSKRRPDILLHLGYQAIIVEIDENQHKRYDCSCENRRLMEISNDLGYIPLVFIRFNPDGYINDNKKVTSCWSVSNSLGLPTVKYNKQKDWNNRLEVLKDQIQYWIDNKTNKTVEIIQLFYDSESVINP